MATNVNGEAFDAGYQAKYDQRTTEFADGTKALESLRMQRNARLAETDWWVLPDRTATEAQLAYRQALRNLPDNSTPVLDNTTMLGISGVTWPTKPS